MTTETTLPAESVGTHLGVDKPWRSTKPRAVVIGSGFGGLASALRLQVTGVDTTILEALDGPGGRAGTYEAEGFTFDLGPTIVTAPHLLRELFALTGSRLEDEVELIPLEPYYQVRFADGSHVNYGTAHGTAGESLRAQLERLEPGAGAALSRFLQFTARLYQRAFIELGAKDFGSVSSMLGVLPDLIGLRADRSVYSLVSRYFRDPRLRTLFSFHPLFIGGNPLRASSVYAIVPHLEQVGGVHYVRGGMHALVKALLGAFQRSGGEVVFGARAQEILVDDAGTAIGVSTEDGRTWPADAVISNADTVTTYKRMVPLRWRKHWTDRRLSRLKLSMSCYLLYLGVRRQYPHLHHHTIVMPKDYPGVLTDLFDRRVMPHDIAIYLHAPSRTDPSVAPPGCETLYALVPVPHLDGRIDWATEAPRLRERVLDFLEQRLGLADLRKHIAVTHERTPVDFRDVLGSERGAAFSIQPLLLQSAYFRPHNRSEDVRRLYIAGAGTHPGAGIPGVLLAGEISARAVLSDLLVEPSNATPNKTRHDARTGSSELPALPRKVSR